ncbi:MAG: NAD(P)-dependent oxidoreductase [Chitinophagaceae bacterium]|nr:MAG: NAD(P)-dependent oxidoreductase [Chitinophagaceae bacterium]
MSKQANNSVAVAGIGSMGKKLVELLKLEYNLTIWNRTRSRIPDFDGVQIAATAAEAFHQGAIVIICVHDYTAVKQVFDSLPHHTNLDGKLIVNFTTISPAEAKELETTFSQHGAIFINGALQVAPDQMGLPETTILLSGDRSGYDRLTSLLSVLGGNLRYLGEDISLSSVGDLAMLTWFYGSYFGMIHAVELSKRSGLSLKSFSDLLAEVAPGFIAFMQHQVQTIEKDDFTITQSPLSISVPAVHRINDSLLEKGIHSDMWASILGLFHNAEKANLVNQELAAIVKVIGNK